MCAQASSKFFIQEGRRKSAAPLSSTLGAMNTRNLKFAFAYASIATFLLCLPFEAVLFERTCPPDLNNSSHIPVAGLGNTPIGEVSSWTSFKILLLGGISLFGGLGCVGWLANVAYYYSARSLLNGEYLKPRVLSLISILLATFSLKLTNIFYVPGDEGGVCRLSAIKALPGYTIWLSAIFVLLLSAWLPRMRVMPRMRVRSCKATSP